MYQKQEETYIVFLILAIGIFFIFISFCFLIYRQFQKNRKLFLEKLNAEYLGRGEERRRISNDLHDEFGALLSTTKMYLSTLSKENIEADTLRKSIKAVSEGLNTLHKITNDIYPSALNKNNLNNAIEDMIHENCYRAGVNATLNLNEIEIDKLFDQKSKVQIYWILKEIIINTIKHSKSTKLEINFTKSKNEVIIKTKDDGVGISFDLESNKRNGIANITNRVEILGGNIELLSKSNKGVEYLIIIPTSHEEKN